MTERTRWSDHPNFGGPASLILDIHDSFRQASSFLVGESGKSVPDWRAVRQTFARLASVLHHHHHAEEVMLFPGMARAGASPEGLVDDHRALLAAIGAAERALVDREGAPDALVRLDQLLRQHLDLEESIAVPYLLEHPEW